MKNHLKKLFISATECFWWGLFIFILIAIFGISIAAIVAALNKWTILPLLVFLWAWAYDRAKNGN
jgi:DNA-binding LytR/AlgR family response regulator